MESTATALAAPTERPRTRPLFGAGLGLLGGAAAAMNAIVAAEWLPGRLELAGSLALGAALGALAMLGLDLAARPLLAFAGPDAAKRMGVLAPVSSLPALLPVLGAFGLHVPLALVALLLLLARGGAVVAAMPPARRGDMTSSIGWLSFLFLLSGFAALIYQIVWQRTLFTAFGVNIESITVIVSLFMFGLGVGSFVGGILSHRFPDKAPLLFFACEVGIGTFGAVSLPLIDAVSRATLFGSIAEVALAVFALLFVPTMLMGATLPILVTHLDRRWKSVGRSVGLLYCINTVGSAIACFLTADVLFVVLGQQGSVLVAAGFNLAVGFLVLRFARAVARRGEDAVAGEAARRDRPLPKTPPPVPLPPAPLPTGADGATTWIRKAFVLFLSAAVGYVSLSQEMVWMRVVGYMTGGAPAVFAHVLGFFLAGVAFGAFFAEKRCERGFLGADTPMRFVARMLVVSGVFYFASIAATAAIHDAFPPAGVLVAHLIVAVVSFLTGGVFPVLCHYGAKSGRTVGLAVSRLYLANIVGSTLGPLLTGFVWMERFSTPDVVLGLSVATLLLAALAWAFDAPRSLALPAGAVAAAAVLVALAVPLYARLFERIHHDRTRAYEPYRVLVENRHGVVATAVSAKDGADVIHGGGVYDGTMNTDPRTDSNGIERCFMMAALHPGPRDVLEIGMSAASWTRVMGDYGWVRRLTVVEINPGYLDVIRSRDAQGNLLYPRQASVLSDPKIDVVVDDGRRWLARHPGARFDFILQNTPHHWRSQITNLVSEEYLRLCKSRLNPGGVLYMNSTWSYDVPYTAAHVFRHVVTVRNFVAASDSPFDLPPERIRVNLLRFSADGRPVFDESRAEDRAILDRFSQWPSSSGRAGWDQAPDFRAARSVPGFPVPAAFHVVTDDNMATEYKRTSLLAHAPSWPDWFRRLSESWD